MAAHEPLGSYLHDHLAGATAGVDLARRIAEDTRDRPMGRVLEQLADDIQADRAVLQDLIEKLGFNRRTVKQAAAWMAEKTSRLRLNPMFAGSDDLALLMSLETLSMGVDGKRNLWQSLQEIAAQEPAVAELDVAALEQRAEAQHKVLEAQRRAVAPAALKSS